VPDRVRGQLYPQKVCWPRPFTPGAKEIMPLELVLIVLIIVLLLKPKEVTWQL